MQQIFLIFNGVYARSPDSEEVELLAEHDSPDGVSDMSNSKYKC
jgi:hypothetical protein